LDKCFSCSGRAVYLRPYSGEAFCKKCFAASIERRVQHTISEYHMLRPDDRIAVALSGGKDSTSLLHMLKGIEVGFPRSKLMAVTIDEGVASYRPESIRIAERNCGKLGVEHQVFSFRELFGCTLDQVVTRAEGASKLSACTICGVLRRKALNIAAKRVGATKLVTAHNLDDEAQSMLMNTIRGDFSRMGRVMPALGGDDPGFVQRVKPLCMVPEDEVALYAYFKGIAFQSVVCPYAESSIRQDVRVFLNGLEAKHAGTKFAIYRSFERIRSNLTGTANQSLRSCSICGEPTAGEVCQSCRILQDLGLP
jgi:uncharacterized protein (TIGR00269 family)